MVVIAFAAKWRRLYTERFYLNHDQSQWQEMDTEPVQCDVAIAITSVYGSIHSKVISTCAKRNYAVERALRINTFKIYC